MYETLTAFIPYLEEGPFGKRFYNAPTVDYEEKVFRFIDEVYWFSSDHEEVSYRNCYFVLSGSGITGLCVEDISKVDISSLDGLTIAAIIVGVIRGERQVAGVVLQYLESGLMQRLLERLKSIDESDILNI